ncbi:uncharacterized protein RAG0_08343 [Rhynchosporium agropyri]|uniref:Uncharacterized protein n=2 Tax=Rhynchosporium TaxID=38037 RepID=A0A1E1KQE2_9HELO|nr:uncharacterized protein RAG0_08343 [Rhynchosporium agropyri]CZT05740.1 uncharacterized protein RCO7_03909 [Rhynchosporium commune]
MASSSADAADAVFWKAYGTAIKRTIGQITINEKTAFYLATKAQAGPPGGDGIFPSFTNEGLFQLGNNLLPPDQLFYSPSTLNSYIGQLQTYLHWVDVGGNPSDVNVTQVTNTLQDMNAAQIGLGKQLTLALADFKQQQDAGLAGTQTFAQWAPGNAVGYTMAVQSYKSKAAAYQKAVSNAYGPLASQKLDDEAKLQKALDTLTSNTGFNMECVLGSPPSPREFNNAVSSGSQLPAPPGVLRPAYNAPGYITAIKKAQSVIGSGTKPSSSMQITYSQGTDVRETSFNQSAQSASVGFSYFPWISFNANASHETTTSSVSTQADASDITITLFYDDMSLVTINPSGSWDLGDVRTKYKGLLPGAPKEVQTLVKPTQLLLATRLGYKVKLGASSSKQFDSYYRDTVSGGGSVSIFGIPCSIGGDASRSTENTTHNLAWNSTTQEFTVDPTDNAGFATIVGLIGEKVTTGA